MAWHHRFWNVLRPGRKQRDLERELAFHLAERMDDLEAAGLSAAEARRLARRQFGNYTTQMERTRDMDTNTALESLLRNLRLAARGLVNSPGFSITVILTLALGIGANSAVFSAIDAVLLRPLPFPNAGQLVKLGQVQPKLPQPFVAPVRLEDWNRLNTTFQAISGYYVQDDSELSGEMPEKMKRAFVAPRFLQVWGIAPALGRDFTREEEHFGGPNAVLISDRLWRRRFNSDPNVTARSLRLGRNYTVPIVGVLPASFLFPDRDVDLWSPSPNDAPFAVQNRDLTWYSGIGRMKPGVTIEQARADLSAVQANLGRQFPKTDAEMKAKIDPMKEATVGGVRRSLWIVFGSVSLLLLIACTNIAALLLSRAAGRQHEISVRFSLGASRLSVAAQLLMEVFVLAIAGAGVGLLLAGAASRIFRVLAKDLPRVDEIALDWRIVFYTLGSAVAVTLLCGALPAMRATRRSLSIALASAGRSQVGGRHPVQFVLVGVQVALAVTLLAGAGLLLRSFRELGRVSPGFEPEHVLTFHISTSWAETNDSKAGTQRTRRILDSLPEILGVESAATSISLPGVPGQYPVEVKPAEGRAETETKMLAEERFVSPSYFATLQIPLMAGEMCRRNPGRPVMLINRVFAGRYFSGGSAIGRTLVEPANPYIKASTIIGIVGDARETGLDREPVPTIYWCSEMSQPGTYFLVRAHGAPKALAETVRRKIRELEPLRSVYDITPLSDHISDSYAENRLRTILLTFFAATAVGLACVGLYGTLSYLVNIRRREVGLRLALGALRSRIVRQFLAQGLRVSLIGCAVGLVLAAITVRLLAGMLYGVTPSDPVTLIAVVVTVIAVSAIASLLPAVRAARLEPMRVLRDE
jgi:predicted permease